jgi:hypothetical protein
MLAVILFSSCSQEEPQTVVLEGVPFIREGIIDTTLVVVHESTDFCDWKSAYKSLSDEFDANGLKKVALYQGYLDTNLVVGIYGVNDMEKAKQFVASKAALKTLYQVAKDDGLKFLFLDQSLAYTESADDSIFHLMSFKTLKYERWEEAFLQDYQDDPNHEFAVTNVFRGIENNNHIYMLFRVNDPQYVEKMEKNNAFKMKMLASGVISYPETYKLKDVSL